MREQKGCSPKTQASYEQIHWFSVIMEKYDVQYWTDSGTLLGLVREGQVLAHDSDLDFGLWDTDIPKLLLVLDFLKGQQEYRIIKEFFLGQLFKCKIVPADSEKLTIDINIFRRRDGHAWCPQKFVPPNPYRISDPRFWLLSCIRTPICFLWNNVAVSTSITEFPWNLVSEIRTWWIPEKYFVSVKLLDNWNVYVPQKYTEYLTLRYGDWETPSSSWSFWEQDGALAHWSPNILVEQ